MIYVQSLCYSQNEIYPIINVSTYFSRHNDHMCIPVWKSVSNRNTIECSASENTIPVPHNYSTNSFVDSNDIK